MKNTIFTLSIILVLLIGFTIGIYFNDLTAKDPKDSLLDKTRENTSEDGSQTAGQQPEDSDTTSPEADYLEGVVESVSQGRIVFKVDSPDFLADIGTSRTVLISPETEVIFYRERTDQEISQAKKVAESEYNRLFRAKASLRPELEDCQEQGSTEAECEDIYKQVEDIDNQIDDIGFTTDDIEVLQNPSLDLLEPGLRISVTAKTLENGERQDISVETEFEADRIVLQSESAPM